MTNEAILDPTGIIGIDTRMTRLQTLAVALCMAINALDGFDVLAVAFTAPAIAREWHLSPVDLGSLFSAGLIGMAIGAFFISPFADRIGRRAMVILCLMVLAAGMGASATVDTFRSLWILRFCTGLGIGAMLATLNTLVAEFSTPQRRSLCIGLMSLGYPIGAAVGGGIAAVLIGMHGWRFVYLFGAVIALSMIPFVLALLPESIDFLLMRQPPAALATANRTLRRLGRAPLAALPPQIQRPRDSGAARIAAPGLRSKAILICLAFFGMMMTMFFAQNWTPKLLGGLGFSDAGGISGSMVMNLAGVAGCLAFGLNSARFGLRRLGIAVMLGLFAGVVFFGVAPPVHAVILVAICIMGFFMYGCIAALYASVAAIFPVEARATGTGLALGIGRLGAIAGPYVAGILIQAGWSRAAFCLVLALPMLVAAYALWRIPALEPAEAA